MRNQKIALVTGANKGIGFEVARQLAAKGFRVFIGARNEKAGRAAARKFGLANIVWSPLEGGWLSGKYRRDDPKPEGARRSRRALAGST